MLKKLVMIAKGVAPAERCRGIRLLQGTVQSFVHIREEVGGYSIWIAVQVVNCWPFRSNNLIDYVLFY